MTLPILVGLGMTIGTLLTYKLKPRFWRKWLGMLMLVCGVIAFFKLSSKSDELFAALLMLTVTGYSLFSSRDQFTRDED
jgi:predicted MFS family arabinose efflux permease